MDFARPKILVSKCLTFDYCRYNGQRLNDDFIDKLKKFVDFVPVCAEVEIGLGVPRKPVKLVYIKEKVRLIQSSNEKDFTDKIIEFSNNFFDINSDFDGAILKSRSPSCGIASTKVYDFPFSEKKNLENYGLFTKSLQIKYPALPKEDEGRLKNFKIREDFLTKIFLLADFKGIFQNKKMSELVNFHTKNKYLYMAYSQNALKKLGNIVGNLENLTEEKVFEKYKKELDKLLLIPQQKQRFINSITHIFGYFKNDLTYSEKEFFLSSVELYKEGRIPTTSLIMLLKSWAIGFNEKYILNQMILNPFPEELIELSDSGRVLNL